jgi:glycine/D-amino acid oxidase-like deaminating enzyme
MDLRSDYPFWLLKDGIIRSYPSLQDNVKTEVAIIGAGITGALMAFYLGKAGFKVIMADRRHVGMGSTAATTGLLQYEIDTPLRKLIKLVGEKHAVRSYELCVESLHKLYEAVANASTSVDFEFKPSFQYASEKSHVAGLREEFILRKKHQLSKVEWLEPNEIKSQFGFSAPAGLLSRDGAQINAYKLTHQLLGKCIEKFDLKVYDSTEIIRVKTSEKDVELRTSEGKIIKAGHLIICAGYESETYLPKKIEIRKATYAIVSEPFVTGKFWHEDALIWETAIPYLYIRTTLENRILLGGRDDDFYKPEKRDRRISFKARQLIKDFNKKFPHIPLKIDFQWAGTFCETKDGLPYIGKVDKLPNTYFALGFGGNGITFSLIAAEIILDLLKGRANADAEIFSFNRL